MKKFYLSALIALGLAASASAETALDLNGTFNSGKYEGVNFSSYIKGSVCGHTQFTAIVVLDKAELEKKALTAPGANLATFLFGTGEPTSLTLTGEQVAYQCGNDTFTQSLTTDSNGRLTFAIVHGATLLDAPGAERTGIYVLQETQNEATGVTNEWVSLTDREFSSLTLSPELASCVLRVMIDNTAITSGNIGSAMQAASDGVKTSSGTTPVPEPTTATLSLLALGALAARRRRK